MRFSVKTLVGIACIAFAGAALAQEYPKLKSGQWELAITTKSREAGPQSKRRNHRR